MQTTIPLDKLHFGHEAKPPINARTAGRDDVETARLVGFIGVGAYKAAGGTMIEDLFGQAHRVNDPKLALKLATDKFKSMSDQMIADGWAFAGTKQDLGYDWNWTMTRGAGKAKTTSAQKARIEELQKIIDAAEELDDDTPEANAAQVEIAAIEEAIELTAYTPEDRKKSGVMFGFAHNGALENALWSPEARCSEGGSKEAGGQVG